MPGAIFLLCVEYDHHGLIADDDNLAFSPLCVILKLGCQLRL